MAYETFIWRPVNNPVGTVSLRVLRAQFGDGYAQEAQDGINVESGSWPLQFVGQRDALKPIIDFFRANAGYKKFYWTPPLGDVGLYVCTGWTVTPQGGPVYTINATFEQRFAA